MSEDFESEEEDLDLAHAVAETKKKLKRERTTKELRVRPTGPIRKGGAFEKGTAEVSRMISGTGAGYFVRADPPRLSADGLPCGNPIDGQAYFFVIDRKKRTDTRYLLWGEVLRAAAEAGVQLGKPRVLTGTLEETTSRDALIDRVLQPGVAFKDSLVPAWKAVLAGTARVEVQTAPDTWADAPASLPRGTTARVVLHSPTTLRRLAVFVEVHLKPQFEQRDRRLFAAPVKDRQLLRMKTTAKSRRGKRSLTGGGAYEEAALIGKQPKSGPVTVEGDIRYHFAAVEGNQVVFYRIAHDEVPGFNKLLTFQLYAETALTVQRSMRLTDAIVSLSRQTGSPFAPRGIDPTVVEWLIRSAMVFVDQALVLTPDTLVSGGAKITIGAKDKAESPFYSWTRSWLPPGGGDALPCDTGPERHRQRKRISPGAYTVFMTYNPILFEATRMFWPSKQADADLGWGSVLAQPKMAYDLDAAGRFGVAASLVQRAAVGAAQGESLGARLRPTLARVQGHDLATIVRDRQGGFKAFNLLWGLGRSPADALQDAHAFLADPVGFTRQIKTHLDRTGIPRTLRTSQLGASPRLASSRVRVADGPAALLAVLGREAEPFATKTEAVEALKQLQAVPPRIRERQSNGEFAWVELDSVPVTGEFDRPTLRLLTRILAAPKLPPGAHEYQGQPHIPTLTAYGSLAADRRSTMGRARDQLRGLATAIQEIDRAIAALPES